MPEGDTLHNIAAKLRPVLVSKPVVRLEFPRLAGETSDFVGSKVIEVEARGKNLLIHFDNGFVLHTHLKMPGAWHLYRPGESWKRSLHAARVVLEVPDAQAVCFQAPVVRVLKAAQLKRDPRLDQVGPDLLGDTFDDERAVQRLETLKAWPLGEAVMHQPAVSGIGNVWKSEVLFLEQLDPFQPVEAVPRESLRALLLRTRGLMQKNVDREGAPAPPRRTTRFEGVTDGTRVWVYRRRGMPCFRCGTTVRMKRQGDALRSTYFCPTCQHVSAERLKVLFG